MPPDFPPPEDDTQEQAHMDLTDTTETLGRVRAKRIGLAEEMKALLAEEEGLERRAASLRAQLRAGHIEWPPLDDTADPLTIAERLTILLRQTGPLTPAKASSYLNADVRRPRVTRRVVGGTLYRRKVFASAGDGRYRLASP